MLALYLFIYPHAEAVLDLVPIAKAYKMDSLLQKCLSAAMKFDYNVSEGSSTDAVLWIKQAAACQVGFGTWFYQREEI